ncbi:MAG: M17 family metallopeptidase [Myxococcota bacterium]
MKASFTSRVTKHTVTITPLTQSAFQKWKGAAASSRWVEAKRFQARMGEICLLPNPQGGLEAVLLGLGDEHAPWAYGALNSGLPPGRYRVDGDLPPERATDAGVGFGLGAYVFDRYKQAKETGVELVWPEGADRAAVTRLVESTELVRDLINTPAQDMGPADLAAEIQKVGRVFGARTSVIEGPQLLKKNYPAVHAVGRAAAQAPRLIDLRWGRPSDPKVTLVGKGVCFDSGGLDLKPAQAMLLMKKDMGGAAIALGLARCIMDAKLRVRLRLLVPAVENAVSGNAFHPQDILATRKGLTVEVGNTDAEGRLILADALAEAASEQPEMILDFATLTGSARIALGTEVPVLFSNDDDLAERVLESSVAAHDPVWRLPLFAPYKRHLESLVADLSNTGSSKFGGAITAALFLEHFVGDVPWVHVDAMAYNLDAQPGRPVGGEAQSLRAFYRFLSERYAKQ